MWWGTFYSILGEVLLQSNILHISRLSNRSNVQWTSCPVTPRFKGTKCAISLLLVPNADNLFFKKDRWVHVLLNELFSEKIALINFFKIKHHIWDKLYCHRWQTETMTQPRKRPTITKTDPMAPNWVMEKFNRQNRSITSENSQIWSIFSLIGWVHLPLWIFYNFIKKL